MIAAKQTEKGKTERNDGLKTLRAGIRAHRKKQAS
jgi:hypothetical protein